MAMAPISTSCYAWTMLRLRPSSAAVAQSALLRMDCLRRMSTQPLPIYELETFSKKRILDYMRQEKIRPLTGSKEDLLTRIYASRQQQSPVEQHEQTPVQPQPQQKAHSFSTTPHTHIYKESVPLSAKASEHCFTEFGSLAPWIYALGTSTHCTITHTDRHTLDLQSNSKHHLDAAVDRLSMKLRFYSGAFPETFQLLHIMDIPSSSDAPISVHFHRYAHPNLTGFHDKNTFSFTLSQPSTDHSSVMSDDATSNHTPNPPYTKTDHLNQPLLYNELKDEHEKEPAPPTVISPSTDPHPDASQDASIEDMTFSSSSSPSSSSTISRTISLRTMTDPPDARRDAHPLLTLDAFRDHLYERYFATDPPDRPLCLSLSASLGECLVHPQHPSSSFSSPTALSLDHWMDRLQQRSTHPSQPLLQTLFFKHAVPLAHISYNKPYGHEVVLSTRPLEGASHTAAALHISSFTHSGDAASFRRSRRFVARVDGLSSVGSQVDLFHRALSTSSQPRFYDQRIYFRQHTVLPLPDRSPKVSATDVLECSRTFYHDPAFPAVLLAWTHHAALSSARLSPPLYSVDMHLLSLYDLHQQYATRLRRIQGTPQETRDKIGALNRWYIQSFRDVMDRDWSVFQRALHVYAQRA